MRRESNVPEAEALLTGCLPWLLDVSSDAVLVCDPDGRIVLAGDATEALFGYRAEELLGRPVELLVPPEAGDRHRVLRSTDHAAARPRRMGEGRELHAVHRDGRRVPVEVSLAPLVLDGRTFVVSVVRDLSVHGDLERSRRSVEAQTLEVARLRSLLAAIENRGTRHPLDGIPGLTELLAGTALDDTQRRFVDRLRTSGTALTSLVEDILDLCRVETGRLVPDPVRFAPRRLVEEALAVLEPGATGRGLAFVVDVRPSTPSALRGDAGRLRRILLNLVGNAVTFTEAGIVRVQVSCDAGEPPRPPVEGAPGRPGDAAGRAVLLRLEVSDSGVGIAPELVRALHASGGPVEQGAGPALAGTGGRGIGLTLCRELIRVMGGSLEVSSQQGVGTTCVVLLPVEVVESGPGGRSPGTAGRSTCRGSSGGSAEGSPGAVGSRTHRGSPGGPATVPAGGGGTSGEDRGETDPVRRRLEGLLGDRGRGKSALVARLVGSFRTRALSVVEATVEAAACGDDVLARMRVHGLCTAASTLGASDVAQLCHELEIMAQAGMPEEILPRVPELLTLLERFDDLLVEACASLPELAGLVGEREHPGLVGEREHPGPVGAHPVPGPARRGS